MKSNAQIVSWIRSNAGTWHAVPRQDGYDVRTECGQSLGFEEIADSLAEIESSDPSDYCGRCRNSLLITEADLA